MGISGSEIRGVDGATREECLITEGHGPNSGGLKHLQDGGGVAD